MPRKNTYTQVFKRQRKLLEKASAQARNELGITFIAVVVPRVPVDTGRARANWNAAVGAIDESTDENRFDPSGTTTPRRIRLAIQRLPKDGVLNISNWLQYIARLNAGYSQQAPAGFLDSTAGDMARLAPKLLSAALTK